MIRAISRGNMPTGDTRLIDLSVDELEDVITRTVKRVLAAELPQALTEAERRTEDGLLKVGRERYDFGIDGIARTFGVSRTTARRIKRSGVIDEAISQCGRSITINQTRALELTRGTRLGAMATAARREMDKSEKRTTKQATQQEAL